MDNDVKVSVLCLAYNHEKYIEKALKSMVCQKTNFKFEILVHDDASTDNTPNIIKKYAEQYPELIKPIFQTENQYSKGVEIVSECIVPCATGKYFAFLECDDCWCDENNLQLQFDFMESHPECSLCVHNTAKYDLRGHRNRFSLFFSGRTASKPNRHIARPTPDDHCQPRMAPQLGYHGSYKIFDRLF